VNEGKPVRIGGELGCLDQQLLTEMMDANAALAEPRDARDVTMDAMVASATAPRSWLRKSACRTTASFSPPRWSGVQDLVDVYRKLATLSDYPLHSGSPKRGWEQGHHRQHCGPRDPAPGGRRRYDPSVADTAPRRRTAPRKSRSRSRCSSRSPAQLQPQVTACPGCGRTTSTFFQEMAEQIEAYLRKQRPVWKERYPGSEELHVAVMGCVSSTGRASPSTAKSVSPLPGTAEEPARSRVRGRCVEAHLKGDAIVADFLKILASTWKTATRSACQRYVPIRLNQHDVARAENDASVSTSEK